MLSLLSLIGFVEALVSNLGKDGSLYPSHFHGGLPDDYLFKLLYGSAVLLFCLIVCLVGAGKGGREERGKRRGEREDRKEGRSY